VNWSRGLFRLWVVTISFLIIVLAPKLIHAQPIQWPNKADLIKFDRERNFEKLPRGMLTKEGDLVENVSFSLGVQRVRKDRKPDNIFPFWYEDWDFRCAQFDEISPSTTCTFTRKRLICFGGLYVEKFEHDALGDVPYLFVDAFDSKSKTITFRFRLGLFQGPWYVVKAKIGELPTFLDSFSTTSFLDKDDKTSEFVEYEYVSQKGKFQVDIPCKILAYGITPDLEKPLASENLKAR